MNRYLVSRRFGRSPYSIIFSFWLIGYNLFTWSLLEKTNGWEDPCKGKNVLVFGRRIIRAPFTLIDWFKTSKLWFLHWTYPRFIHFLKGMSGLESSAEALHIQKSQKPPCLIEDPGGRRFRIFSNRILRNDFINKFVKIKTSFRDHSGANVSLADCQSRLDVKWTTCVCTCRCCNIKAAAAAHFTIIL